MRSRRRRPSGTTGRAGWTRRLRVPRRRALKEGPSGDHRLPYVTEPISRAGRAYPPAGADQGPFCRGEALVRLGAEPRRDRLERRDVDDHRAAPPVEGTKPAEGRQLVGARGRDDREERAFGAGSAGEPARRRNERWLGRRAQDGENFEQR